MTKAELVQEMAAAVREQRAADREAYEAVLATLRTEIGELRELVKSMPVPKDGRDGRDGKDADPAAIVREVLAQIPVPENGKDGRDGEKGVDGRDGRDGKDGIASRDEVREEVAKAVESRMPEVREFVAKTVESLPVVTYRRTYQANTEYPAGSVVTWGGSAWHANEATSEKPGEGKTAWTLMVKRGTDGKDAR